MSGFVANELSAFCCRVESSGGRSPELLSTWRAEQAALLDDISNTTETAASAFFSTEEHGVVLIGGIVHGADKIPLLIWNPFVSASILMDHHAGKG